MLVSAAFRTLVILIVIDLYPRLNISTDSHTQSRKTIFPCSFRQFLYSQLFNRSTRILHGVLLFKQTTCMDPSFCGMSPSSPL